MKEKKLLVDLLYFFQLLNLDVLTNNSIFCLCDLVEANKFINTESKHKIYKICLRLII